MATQEPDASREELIIAPGRADLHYWRDLWRYRELFLILAWRDIAVRYKQTAIGVAWAVIRPFLTMVVFTVVFGRLAGLPSPSGAPYALMVFAGMLPWFLFASSLTGAAESMVANANLIGKVYFPRLIVPIATIVAALVDFIVSLVMLFAVMAWYGYVPGWQIVLLPVFVLLAIAASVGPGLWMASLNMKYRDFRFIIPFLIQIGIYVSPVGFSSAIVPEHWRLAYSLNPLVGIIDGFRWCIVGGPNPFKDPTSYVGLAVILVFLAIGLSRFRATERQFADLA